MITLRRANERGHFNHGWLNTYHTFSFADYRDPKHVHFRALRVINEDVIDAGRGFGMHPHENMEIITYVLSGALEHQDSMGNGRIIRPGEFQYMAAGTGVLHSEFNPSKDEAVHLLQIWILPDHAKARPAYAEKRTQELAGGVWHLITSKTGRDDSMTINQDADLWLARLASKQTLERPVAAGRHAWLHVAEGEVNLNGQTLVGGDAAAVDGSVVLKLEATKASQVLLFDLN